MVLGDELGGGLYEDRDDLEGPAAERHGDPARPQLAPGEVDLPLIARIDQISACFRTPASRLDRLNFAFHIACGYCETEVYCQTYDRHGSYAPLASAPAEIQVQCLRRRTTVSSLKDSPEASRGQP